MEWFSARKRTRLGGNAVIFSPYIGYYSQPYLQEGGYANGGLLPWVGGELYCAAFRFGREAYAVELLRAYAEHLRRTGGAQVWYWPDGTPGFRTTNEVAYTGWVLRNDTVGPPCWAP